MHKSTPQATHTHTSELREQGLAAQPAAQALDSACKPPPRIRTHNRHKSDLSDQGTLAESADYMARGTWHIHIDTYIDTWHAKGLRR